MLSVVALPIFALIVICCLQLTAAIQAHQAAEQAISAFGEFLRIDNLVIGVQQERGMSAAWLSSRGSNADAERQLQGLWAQNNEPVTASRPAPAGRHVTVLEVGTEQRRVGAADSLANNGTRRH